MRGLLWTTAALLVGLGRAGEAALAHDGGRPITEAEALHRLAGKTVAGGKPDSCDGVDRKVGTGATARYRHFFCYFMRAESFGPDGPTELTPVARVELHSLANGTTVLLNLKRRWKPAPPWIDDRPGAIGSLVGLPLTTAVARLEAGGYDIIGGARGSYTIATPREFKDVTAGIVVCAQRTRGTGTTTEIVLVIGFRRCSGPPFLAPPTPDVRGLTLRKAIAALGQAGIDFDNWWLVDRLLPDYEGHVDGWVVCSQSPAAGKRGWSTTVGLAKTTARCPT